MTTNENKLSVATVSEIFEALTPFRNHLTLIEQRLGDIELVLSAVYDETDTGEEDQSVGYAIIRIRKEVAKSNPKIRSSIE